MVLLSYIIPINKIFLVVEYCEGGGGEVKVVPVVGEGRGGHRTYLVDSPYYPSNH